MSAPCAGAQQLWKEGLLSSLGCQQRSWMMKFERQLGLTVRKSLVMLGRVVSVCGMRQDTLEKGVGL